MTQFEDAGNATTYVRFVGRGEPEQVAIAGNDSFPSSITADGTTLYVTERVARPHGFQFRVRRYDLGALLAAAEPFDPDAAPQPHD